MSTAFSDACIHSFPHIWCNPVKSLCSDRNGSPDEILSICLAQGNREMWSWTRSGNKIRTRCQVFFDSEHSLHLWNRHPCTSTVWRQLTDWRKLVTTWRDLLGLLYSYSDTMCLLIQSNCIELQPSINILICVAWLFDHSVLWNPNTITL
jgi:hypothetical protein